MVSSPAKFLYFVPGQYVRFGIVLSQDRSPPRAIRYHFITLDVVVRGCLEARGRVWLNARVGVHLKCSERMPQNVTNCIRKMDGVATPSPATSPFWGPEKNYRRELIMKKRLVAVSSFLLYLEGKLVVGRWKLHACYDCHVVLCVIEDGERCMNWVEFRGDRTALEVTEPRKFMQRRANTFKIKNLYYYLLDVPCHT